MWVWLFGRGVRRGVMGGSRMWTVVAAVAGLARLVGWMNREKVVFREELKPGETLVVANDRSAVVEAGRDAVMMEG